MTGLPTPVLVARSHRILFSGDLGYSGRAILRDPTVPPKVDTVVMESTYGDRLHKALLPSIQELYVMAGYGMCTGGRVRHHLKHGLWNERNSLIFVGFAARGTLARQIIDGAERVMIFGKEVRVRASIHTIGGFSAHADQAELLAWHRHTGGTNPNLAKLAQLESSGLRRRAEPVRGGKAQLAGLGRAPRAPKIEDRTGPNAMRTCSHLVQFHTGGPKTTYLVHGEEPSMRGLASKLQGTSVVMPELGQSFEL